MKLTIKIFFIIINTSTAVLFLFVDMSISADSEILDIVPIFYQKVNAWIPIIKKYTLSLFKILLTIDIAMLGIHAALKRTPIEEVLEKFIMLLLFAGLILAFINNYQEWSMELINGISKIGGEINPSVANTSPFQIGMNICGKVFALISIWDPVSSLGYLISALAIIICFALITAQIIFIKCEAIVAFAASMLLLGFGGSSFTKDYAINVLRYILSVAFKLFVMQLILGLGMSFLESFPLEKVSYKELFLLIGSSIILLALVKSLPDVVSGIINGSHVSTGHHLTSTAASVGAMAAGVTVAGLGVAGRGATGIEAAKQAGLAAAEEGKTGRRWAARTAGILGESYKQASQDMPGQSAIKKTLANSRARLQAAREAKKIDSV